MSVIPSFAHQNFNPHPHMEDDDEPSLTQQQFKDISIHILTWRMTGSGHDTAGRHNNFNPHPHMEDDSYIWYILLQNIAYIES